MHIDWNNFTPLASLAGGAAIGFATLIMLLFSGKVTGISNMLGILVKLKKHDVLWRIMFLLGLVLSPLIYSVFAPLPPVQIDESLTVLVIAGVLVGYGTQLGSGCTSGHGICGLSRFSLRSLVATLCFMGVGFATVFVVRHLL